MSIESVSFVCSLCQVRVSSDLRAAVAPPTFRVGADVIPSGYVTVSTLDCQSSEGLEDLPTPWHMLSPSDVVGQPMNSLGQPTDRFGGCCGPSGFDVLNIGCANGHPIGIEQSECWVPHVSVLDPARVVRTVGQAPVQTVVYLARHHPHQTLEEFCAELHTAFGFEEWYGTDLALILGHWGHRSPARIDLVWLNSARASKNRLPMADIEAAFAEQSEFVRLLLA